MIRTQTTTTVQYDHSIRGQIGMPAGGGSPRLYIASSMTRITTETVRPVLGGGALAYKRYIVSSDLRASVSSDFGASLTPGVDVGIAAVNGPALTDARECYYALASGGTWQPPLETTATNTHIVPQTIIVTPQGRVYVRAFTLSVPNWVGPNNSALLPQAGSGMPCPDTVCARICDNALLRAPRGGGSAFRDSATANASAPAFVSTGPDAGYWDYSGLGLQSAVYQSLGAWHGGKGQGTASGPSAMYAINPGSLTGGASYMRSTDGGDTWEDAPDLTAMDGARWPGASGPYVPGSGVPGTTGYGLLRDAFIPWVGSSAEYGEFLPLWNAASRAWEYLPSMVHSLAGVDNGRNISSRDVLVEGMYSEGFYSYAQYADGLIPPVTPKYVVGWDIYPGGGLAGPHNGGPEARPLNYHPADGRGSIVSSGGNFVYVTDPVAGASQIEANIVVSVPSDVHAAIGANNCAWFAWGGRLVLVIGMNGMVRVFTGIVASAATRGTLTLTETVRSYDNCKSWVYA